MSRFSPRLTAVGSGKGGTGKTFFALTLAHHFAAAGEKVLLLDADLGLANAAVQLGLGEAGDLPGLIAGRKPLAEAIVRVGADSGDFDLIAAPAGYGQLADAGEQTADKVLAILNNARGYTRILVDLPAGVGAGTMTLAAHADDALVVTTPDPTAITDAYAFVKVLARRTGGRTPGIVVNMAANEAEAKRTATALIRSAEVFLKHKPDYLGFVPQDGAVGEAIRRQTPLMVHAPASPAAQAIAMLAAALGGEAGKRQRVPSLR
jgi:flagellar biosynthesis protein FlhG